MLFHARTISYSSCSKKWPQLPTVMGTSVSVMRKNWAGMWGHGQRRTMTSLVRSRRSMPRSARMEALGT
jgi:hypothetical protein